MQVILDSSFARPGSAPIWGGKKGEFRDWTILSPVSIQVQFVYLKMAELPRTPGRLLMNFFMTPTINESVYA